MVKILIITLLSLHFINATAQVCFTDTNYSACSESNTITCADINNDGKPDLLVAYYGEHICLLPGDGLGGFGAAIPIISQDSMNYERFISADFNNDGNADLAINKWSGPSIGYIDILFGDGTGSFPTSNTFAVAPYPGIMYSDDFNGDSNPDIILVHNDQFNQISVLLGDGMGHFSICVDFFAGLSMNAITSGDFNGDGKVDFAVTCNGNGGGPDSLWVFLGDGTCNFGTASKYLAGSGPYSVCSTDFNRDGFDDIAVANTNSDNVSVFLSQGMSGAFYYAINYIAGDGSMGSSPFSVVDGDFNLDGNVDLAVANRSNRVYILLGTGTGTFGPSTYYPALYGPWTIISADFNSDGKPDLATANQSSQDVTILLNCVTQGIDDFNYKQDVSIYPNPTTGIFSVETSLSGKLSVQIFYVTGKMILNQNINDKTNIDATCLSVGIYNLTIKSNAGIINKKLVIIK